MKSETAGPAVLDDQRINVHNPLELHAWGKLWGATPAEIRRAIAEVGPFIDKVIERLGKT